MLELDEQPAPLCAGVDEAGRGPLAGPVMAAAVVLDPERPIAGLVDSKRLSPQRREVLEIEIKDRALAWSLGAATVEEIDTVNILQASMLAMQRAVRGLAVTPTQVLVDGNRCPRFTIPARAIVRGDQAIAAISAASILAKVARDREMMELDACYPAYGFALHKGYPTRAHLEALARHGACPLHRKSYAPVRRVIEREG
ncbi:MAG: ribonuclease HII [Gammaproteobacteria bacterium]|nr:ribonuclease HII [Gammaproteobacteria bacterium]NIR98656.1 ribonuclease HII [Gammaproteobacteria bacterium]NIT64370.1 ribonuclease HII [Gammaproteobacteria bacterium]NIV21302.1 ribonuclease HII [Gammaproteobacteria bacterium]NIX11060.1 ribonuclease HII [Gammaproteobacteria bacterium]